MTILFLVLSLAPSARAAEAWPAFPPLNFFLSADETPAGVSAEPAAEPEPEEAKVRLSKAQIQDKKLLDTRTREAFEAYIERLGLGALKRVVARRRFDAAQAWMLPFLQARFTALTLSIRRMDLAGQERLVSVSETEYAGKKVVFYRFPHGLSEAVAVSIDGTLVDDEAGQTRLFIGHDRESFDAFREWFDGRLGAPRS